MTNDLQSPKYLPQYYNITHMFCFLLLYYPRWAIQRRPCHSLTETVVPRNVQQSKTHQPRNLPYTVDYEYASSHSHIARVNNPPFQEYSVSPHSLHHSVVIWLLTMSAQLGLHSRPKKWAGHFSGDPRYSRTTLSATAEDLSWSRCFPEHSCSRLHYPEYYSCITWLVPRSCPTHDR